MSIHNSKIVASQIARACLLGADWLEQIANGEKYDPKDIQLVAGGLRDAVRNANADYAKTMNSIVCDAIHYFDCLDRGEEVNAWWSKSIRDDISKLRFTEIDTFNEIMFPELPYCKICNGKNDIVCPACIGAKELDAGAQCARCNGVGRIVCPKCFKELEQAILYGDGSSLDIRRMK